MSDRSRVIEFAEELRRNGEFTYLALSVVAQGLHYFLSQKKEETPEITITPDFIAGLGNQFEKFFSQAFFEKYAKSILYRIDKWLEEGKPAVNRNLVGLVPPQYQSDEGWQQFCEDRDAARQYSIYIEARLAGYEIQRAIDLENLPVNVLEMLLGFAPKKPVPVTKPRLEAIAAIGTPPPMTTSTRAMTRKDIWKKNSNGIAVFEYQAKGNPQNIIEHYITDPGDITLLPWEEAEQIINNFGLDTVKLQFIFAAHTMKQYEPWKSSFSLKASDVIRELGWNRGHKINKAERLNEIAKLAYVLGCLTVKTVWIEGKHPKGGVNASTPIGRMWNVVVAPHGQLNFEGKIEKPDEVYLTIQPGGWTQVFLNKAGAKAKEALYQFGYLAQSVLGIDPYHNEMALRLAIHLTLESRIHRSGEYHVGTLLKELLPQVEIDEARSDKDKRYDLKRRWNDGLKILMNLKEQQWQIKFDDDSYPEWLRPGSEAKKPKGSKKEKILDQLLKAKITILPPAPIPEWMSGLAPKKSRKSLPPAPKCLTGDQIRKAREAKGWSQRKLAEFMGVSQPTIKFWEQGKRTPDLEKEKKLKRLLDIQD